VTHGERVPVERVGRRRLRTREVVRGDCRLVVIPSCVPRLLEQTPRLFRHTLAFHSRDAKENDRVVRSMGMTGPRYFLEPRVGSAAKSQQTDEQMYSNTFLDGIRVVTTAQNVPGPLAASVSGKLAPRPSRSSRQPAIRFSRSHQPGTPRCMRGSRSSDST
jgi:hypothetical protein